MYSSKGDYRSVEARNSNPGELDKKNKIPQNNSSINAASKPSLALLKVPRSAYHWYFKIIFTVVAYIYHRLV